MPDNNGSNKNVNDAPGSKKGNGQTPSKSRSKDTGSSNSRDISSSSDVIFYEAPPKDISSTSTRRIPKVTSPSPVQKKKKGNSSIALRICAAVLGAVSGLYDKYLMTQLNPMLVQSWYNVYQVGIMGSIIALLWWPQRLNTTPFRWKWTIVCISLFLSAADFAYFYSLSLEDSMVSIVSMVRRSSVVVSFLFGALVFREKNLKSKVIDLILVLIGMFFLYLGSN